MSSHSRNKILNFHFPEGNSLFWLISKHKWKLSIFWGREKKEPRRRKGRGFLIKNSLSLGSSWPVRMEDVKELICNPVGTQLLGFCRNSALTFLVFLNWWLCMDSCFWYCLVWYRLPWLGIELRLVQGAGRYSRPYRTSVKTDFERSRLQTLQSRLCIPGLSFCILNVRNCIDVFKWLMSLIRRKGWHILGSGEPWWVRAICADAFTKRGEGSSGIVLGNLLPWLGVPAFFSKQSMITHQLHVKTLNLIVGVR